MMIWLRHPAQKFLFQGEKTVILDTRFNIRSPGGDAEGLILAIDIQGYHESDRDESRG